MCCKTPSIPVLILSALFLPVIISPAQSQWKNISSGSLANTATNNTVGGTLLYRNGILWAGIGNALWMSADHGLSWSDRSPSVNNDNIIDIDFFDDLNGVVSNYNDIFMTTDGGLSWTFFDNYAVNRSVHFIASPQEMVSRSGTSMVMITRDGGLSWQFLPTPGWGMSQITGHRSGEIDILNWLANTSQILRSTDYGNSWTPVGSDFDKDCWSFATAPCNTGLTVVVNEERHITTDGIACLYISTDHGTSWKTSHPIKNDLYFCGSICISPGGAIFAQTTEDGIIRSTDSGQSWISIGGPNGLPDSRLFCIVGDTIFAADDQGGIWMTSNEGGNPLGAGNPITFSANILFDHSDITLCDSSLATLYMTGSGCSGSDSILQFRIQGAAQGDYLITGATQDSVVITFKPSNSAQRNADLILTMANGGTKIISLAGSGKLPVPLQIATSSATIKTDTIGGDIRVPIIIKGLDRKQTVELDLFFDSTNLLYHGTRSLSGIPLDVAGTTTASSSHISIPKSEIGIDTICAYANFSLFCDSIMISHISFHNLQVVSPQSPCEYLIDSNAGIQAIGPTGCGVTVLSNYMRHGKTPQLFAHPNPVSNRLTLELDLPQPSPVRISLWNAIGEQLQAIEENAMNPGHYERSFDVAALPEGTYFIIVTACGFTEIASVQIIR